MNNSKRIYRAAIYVRLSKDCLLYTSWVWSITCHILSLQRPPPCILRKSCLLYTSHTQKLTAGQCILINSNVVHSTQCTIPNTAIVFQIPLDFIETYIPQVRSLLFHLPEGSADPKERTKLDIFKNTLEKMQIANDMQPDGFLLRFNSLLFEVLFQLYHSFSTKVMHSDFSKKKKELDRLNPVLQYTTEHYNEPISIQEIADVACLQPGYFCRFFKSNMGTTFLEYLHLSRLGQKKFYFFLYIFYQTLTDF